MKDIWGNGAEYEFRETPYMVSSDLPDHWTAVRVRGINVKGEIVEEHLKVPPGGEHVQTKHTYIEVGCWPLVDENTVEGTIVLHVEEVK